MKVCQYPYLLSTKFFPSNQRKNLTFFFSLFRPFPTKNIFLKNLFQNLFPKTKKCLILTLKMKSLTIPPNLSEKLIPPTQFQKILEWNISKKSSAKIRGKTNFHSKILNFINPKFSPKFHLLKSPGKKVRDFLQSLSLEGQRQRAHHFQLYNRSCWEWFSSIRGPWNIPHWRF